MQKITSPKLIAAFNIFLIAMIILPALLCLLFIVRYGVNVVFWDQWEIVTLLNKLHSGNLSVADLFKQHNEHRLFFPFLATIGLAEITHYNNLAEMSLSWVLICLSCFILFKLYSITTASSLFKLASFIPVSWMMFSFAQWENLLWGFQLCIFMCELFLLLSIYLLATAKELNFRFWLSIVCAFICSFTTLQGLVIWLVGFIQITLTGIQQPVQRRRPVIWTGLSWIIAAIIAFALYFVGYVQPPNQPLPLSFMGNPSLHLGYLIAYGLTVFGSALSLNIYMAIPMAILLCIIIIYMTNIVIIDKFRMNAHVIPFYVMALFGIVCIGLLMVGRSIYGLESGGSSRYTTFTLLSISGIYLASVSPTNHNSKYRSLFTGMLVGLIALGIMVTYGYHFLITGNKVQSDRQSGAYFLTTAKDQSNDNLSKIYPAPDIVRQRVDILINNKMNVFSQPAVSLAGFVPSLDQTAYYIDVVNDRRIEQLQDDSADNRQKEQQITRIVINSDVEKTLTISGWAVDSRTRRLAGSVFINVDGFKDLPTIYGLDRPDVADHFNNLAYTKSGFNASFASSAIGKGRHVLSLKIVAADNKAYYESAKKLILQIE